MGGYEGPAGLILTPDEWLEVWAILCRNPTNENGPLRRKIEKYLERGNGSKCAS